MEYYFNEIENFIMKIQLLDYPENIKDKVEYFLQGGKRLRPILCIIFSGLRIINENTNLDTNLDTNSESTTKIIYTIASTIEQLHCLSLVLDDLPEMDNDILRRCKDSFHYKYGTEYTNFFIYYMFNHIGLSLNNIVDNLDSETDTSLDTKYNIEIANRINKLFTYNLNMLIDGQYSDCGFLENSARKINNSKTNEEINSSQFKDEIYIILEFIKIDKSELLLEMSSMIENIELNMKKTSSLFNVSICSGFLLQIWKNKYNLEKYNDIYKKISIWANILGYMFQISDDILDIYNDKEKGSPNLCNIIGKENTSTILKKGCKWLIENIKNIIRESNMSLELNLYAINKLIVKINKRSEL
jgi:geranylgeranyl pyrophosphate synthase